MIYVAAVEANCSLGVENYLVCDICYVTGSQGVIRLIFIAVVHGVRKPTCM